MWKRVGAIQVGKVGQQVEKVTDGRGGRGDKGLEGAGETIGDGDGRWLRGGCGIGGDIFDEMECCGIVQCDWMGLF